MLDYLMDMDTAALLAVNGWNDAFQDVLWWLVSAKWSSALLMLALLWILVRKPGRHAMLVLAMLVLAFVLADQISSGLIKHMVERLRPTREPSLEGLVHIVNGYRGGMYGFVSSHAANSFAVATFISLVIRYRAAAVSLIGWALLQCYSRIYLGVHYPGDIMGGIIVGLAVGWLAWQLMKWLQRRFDIRPGCYNRSDTMAMVWALILTVVSLILIASCILWK